MTLEILIPHKDRPSLLACVQSLLAAIESSSILTGLKIIVGDGGSQQPEALAGLETVQHFAPVTVRPLPHSGFNKSWLLNQLLQGAQADWVLISDADIIWNSAALDQLHQALLSTGGNGIASVQSVLESDPAQSVPKHTRYGYDLVRNEERVTIQIRQEIPQGNALRPGVGLVYAQRQTFLQLGGYKESFSGWGWEDQDLLIRAALLGLPRSSAGEVIHLSHGDGWRNRYCPEVSPQVSRDRNLRHCLQQLEQGQLYGDLPIQLHRVPAYQNPIH